MSSFMNAIRNTHTAYSRSHIKKQPNSIQINKKGDRRFRNKKKRRRKHCTCCTIDGNKESEQKSFRKNRTKTIYFPYFSIGQTVGQKGIEKRKHEMKKKKILEHVFFLLSLGPWVCLLRMFLPFRFDFLFNFLFNFFRFLFCDFC